MINCNGTIGRRRRNGGCNPGATVKYLPISSNTPFTISLCSVFICRNTLINYTVAIVIDPIEKNFRCSRICQGIAVVAICAVRNIIQWSEATGIYKLSLISISISVSIQVIRDQNTWCKLDISDPVHSDALPPAL